MICWSLVLFSKCLDIRKYFRRNADFRKEPYSIRGNSGSGSRVFRGQKQKKAEGRV